MARKKTAPADKQVVQNATIKNNREGRPVLTVKSAPERDKKALFVLPNGITYGGVVSGVSKADNGYEVTFRENGLQPE